jgi:prolyl-tRNA synthetase
MRYSKLFTKTSKTVQADSDSINARYLTQAGYVDKAMAGVYNWLPLGLRTLRKVVGIVREEMDALGGQEVQLTGLQPKENWLTTGRWDSVDVLFKIPSQTGKEYGLAPTAEEMMTPLVQSFVRSYKDLPLAVYQVGTKFRDELRAKSGILRGREFLMKDLYSFHATREDFEQFYEQAKQAYLRVYSRCGLEAKITESSGGAFSKKVSHEFQVETPAGEDNLLLCRACTFAQNSEIATVAEGDACPQCGASLVATKGIEVGNIFDLGDKFSHDFGFQVANAAGEKQEIFMGCYGIGVSRLVGAIVEASHDDRGIIWPKSVAPFDVHLVMVPARDEAKAAEVRGAAEALCAQLEAAGVEVLYDDREDARAGEKFADADLIGLPLRVVVSEKTLGTASVELKARRETEARLVPQADAVAEIVSQLKA